MFFSFVVLKLDLGIGVCSCVFGFVYSVSFRYGGFFGDAFLLFREVVDVDKVFFFRVVVFRDVFFYYVF